jgi:rRNA maturation protein Nop10
MKELCCDTKTISKIPPKYSPEDKYAKYRRQAKKEEML